MVLHKIGSSEQFSTEGFRSADSIKQDKELHDRFVKIATEWKKIAPKAEDFLYFTAIMMHAAERSLYDKDGVLLKNANGSDVEAHWDVNEKTGSWKWISSDYNIKPYKNCFVSGTKILLEDGTVKNIEDIAIGDMVITHKGRARKVLNTFITKHDGVVLNIKTKGRENIICTAEHPFYKLDVVSSADTRNVSPKHILRQLNPKINYIFEQANKLQKYDLLLSPVLNEKIIDSEITPGKARLLGLFAAEGNFGKKYNKDQSVRFTFSTKEYEKLALFTKDLFEKEFGNISVQIQRPANRNICELTVTGKGICKFFRDNAGEYSEFKTLSEEIVFGKKEIKEQFIVGWLDGDGCVEKDSGQTIGVTISPNLASQISVMLNSLNIGHGISKTKEHEIHIHKNNKISLAKESYRILINATEGKDLIKIASRLEFLNHGKEKKQQLFYKNHSIHSIKSIFEQEYVGNVYNFEVEEDNSYVVNNIAVHNCNGDAFPETELKKAYKKWVGKPLCKDHQSSSVDGVRGFIVDTYWDDKYKRIIALCALDKITYPDLARKVATGYANCVSMGTAVGKSICTECGNVAKTEGDYCSHVKNKTAYAEINIDLQPMELSLVVNSADKDATVLEVLAKANNFENNLKKLGTVDINKITEIKNEFNKLSNRIADIENEILLNNNDNILALKRVAQFTNQDETNNFDLIDKKMSNIEGMIEKLAANFNMEDLMTHVADKKAYYQGTEEPTPGKPQYAKEEADKIRMQDSHMRLPLTNLGPVDGLPAEDLEKKKMLARATIEERRALRTAAVEKAQASIKNAYPNGPNGTGEAPKGGYPKDPGANIRDKEFTFGKGNGTTGVLGGKEEEALKRGLGRGASFKARLVRSAKAGDNKWEIVDQSANKVILSASFDELTGNKPALYASVAADTFAKDMMKNIRALGVEKAATLYKSAQPAPMDDAAPPAGDPGMMAPPPEGAPAPDAQEAPVTVDPDSLKEVADTLSEVSGKINEMVTGKEALAEEAGGLPAEGVMANPEAATEQALSDLTGGAPQAATASLNTLRIVLNAGLDKSFKKNIKKLRSAKEELELLISTANNNSISPELFSNLTKEAVEVANKTVKNSRMLQAAFVKYAKGTLALEKRAVMETRMRKMAQQKPATPAPKAPGAPDVKSPEETINGKVPAPAPKAAEAPKTASSEFDLTTVEGRREYRQKLAASVETKIKYSDMIGKAHPKSDTVIGGVDGSPVMHGIDTTHTEMNKAVSDEPKVKKAAEQLDTLIKAGKVNASDLDEMVKEGLDKDAVNYWKKYYGQVDGGSEFAAGLVKEYTSAKQTKQASDNLENYKAKFSKAYDLAYDMAEVGLISKSNSAVKTEAEKIVNYTDDAFSSMRRVVAHHSANMKKTASIQVGVAFDSNDGISAQASDGSFYDELVSAFAGRKY